jgi:diketogulonate reductase-like aldo/keto reductase
MVAYGLALVAYGLAVGAALSSPSGDPTVVDIGSGVMMPRVNLGTCCGSDPKVGLPSWFKSGGVGIDTAFDYDNQADIASLLQAAQKPRASYFLTSKVPAGDHMPGQPGISGSCAADPNASLAYVKASLQQLGVAQIDLVLLHSSCANADPPVPDYVASDNALWRGLTQAKSLGLVRAIGVSNFNEAQLKTLEGPPPAVNQIGLSILPFWGKPTGHDEATLTYCAAHGITAQSYGGLRGCPFGDPRLATIAQAHDHTESQVCLRWVLQRGAVLASGTGSNASTAPQYARENLGIFDFALSDTEMDSLNQFNSTVG